MKIFQFFGYLSGVIALIAFIPYYRDIFRGVTRPERASWLIWGLLDLVALFSQLAKGGSDSLFLPAAYAIGDLGIFFLAFRYGYGSKFLKRDKFSLAGVVVGIGLWYLTSEPLIALGMAILIDWIGAALNIAKCYEDPATETESKWVLTGIAAFLAGIAVGSFDGVLLLFPASIFLMSFATVVAIKLAKNKQKQSSIIT